MTPARRHLLPGLLAIVMPALLVVGALAGLESFRNFEERRELRNAGRIINGVVRQVSTVEYIEDKLDETKPNVVILGNSLSNTDLMPALLARRLGLPKHKVQRFSVPNSLGPHWFAILKNRIYANGHRPEVVIVLSDLQSLLATTPRSEAAYLNLMVQLEDEEPLIDRKVARGNYWWDRIRENRGRMRDRTLRTLRNASVNLFYNAEFSTLERNRTNQALERVFADNNTDMALHSHVIPIFNKQGKELHAYDPADLPLPKDSFIPDITRIVAANGGTTVFLRPPMSPLLPDFAGDQVLPGVEERVQRIIERNGGHYLDMRAFPMNAAHYSNLDHMNNQGARRFTEATAQALLSVDATGSGRREEWADAELLSAMRIVNGNVQSVAIQARFQGELPPIASREWDRNRSDHTWFQAPAMEPLSDRRTVERTPLATRCSPLRVLENRRPLPHHGVSCEEVFKLGRGRVCHVDDRIYFSASDHTSPGRNERTYALAFDPNRTCEGAVWLYPGDEVRLTWADDAFDRFERGARQLHLEVVEMLDRSDKGGRRIGQLDVTLRLGGQEILEERVSVERVRNGPKSWRLDAPLLPRETVELIVDNQSDSFLLLTSAALSERDPG